MDKKNISLVIGTIYEDLNELKILLNNLDRNINYLNEIICIVSGVCGVENRLEVLELNKILKIKIEFIILEKIIMPGEARNIGISKSTCDYICFLDAHPLPDSNWLSNSIKVLENKNLRGVLGKVKFMALNEFEKCFISATYGNKPLNSFQGSLIEKKLFQEIGLFIPKIRSGEDAEWINRSKCFYPKMSQSEVIPCRYIGLKGMNFFELCNKWYLYAKNTGNPKFYSQRIVYYIFSVTFSLLLAFSWNDKVANWDRNSFFYLPHVSKIMIALIFLIYFIYRMLILPIKKKVKIFRFNLIEFIRFCFISLTLDVIKLLAFINHKI